MNVYLDDFSIDDLMKIRENVSNKFRFLNKQCDGNCKLCKNRYLCEYYERVLLAVVKEIHRR